MLLLFFLLLTYCEWYKDGIWEQKMIDGNAIVWSRYYVNGYIYDTTDMVVSKGYMRNITDFHYDDTNVYVYHYHGDDCVESDIIFVRIYSMLHDDFHKANRNNIIIDGLIYTKVNADEHRHNFYERKSEKCVNGTMVTMSNIYER